MKSNCILSCAALYLSTCAAFGQAWFVFRNLNGVGNVDAPVFDAQGSPLSGSNYLAELWGAETPDSLSPLVLFDRGGIRLIKTFVIGGYVDPIDGGRLAVPTVPGYGWAWLQMRSWDARLGATYEEVASHGLGGYGESALFYAQGGNALDLLGVPAPLVGLDSFSLRQVIPEPSTWAVLLLGLLALWWRRRQSG